MKVFESVKKCSSEIKKGSVVTIGNFDGVHVGHRALITTLVAESKSRGQPSVVLTFDPHPIQVLFPERGIERIFNREDQVDELKKMDVDFLVIETFTRELSKTPAETFFKEWIVDSLRPSHVIVGYDFSFGANRSGSIPQLLEFSKAQGFELTIIPPQKIGGETVSSTLIREKIKAADFEIVSKLLGRNFYLEGVVETGDQRGRMLGIPTANLKLNSQILPPQGVYITQSVIGSRHLPSVTNVGVNPTFTDKGELRVETHVLDFKDDVYGKPLKVEFLKKIREEQKFDSPEHLKKQINLDILAAKEYFLKI
jgi:riboflavin kinase / FMN adenylyltransferase